MYNEKRYNMEKRTKKYKCTYTNSSAFARKEKWIYDKENKKKCKWEAWIAAGDGL